MRKCLLKCPSVVGYLGVVAPALGLTVRAAAFWNPIREERGRHNPKNRNRRQHLGQGAKPETQKEPMEVPQALGWCSPSRQRISVMGPLAPKCQD